MEMFVILLDTSCINILSECDIRTRGKTHQCQVNTCRIARSFCTTSADGRGLIVNKYDKQILQMSVQPLQSGTTYLLTVHVLLNDKCLPFDDSFKSLTGGR